MLMFVMHLVMIHAVIVIAAGFITYHFCAKHHSTALKIAAYVLIIGGLLTAACTGYYGMRYQDQGCFEKSGLDNLCAR